MDRNSGGVCRSVAAYEGAPAGCRFNDAFALEISIGAGDGIGVDGKVERELLYGRQLLAGCEEPERDRTFDLLDDLQVDRDAATGIDGKNVAMRS